MGAGNRSIHINKGTLGFEADGLVVDLDGPLVPAQDSIPVSFSGSVLTWCDFARGPCPSQSRGKLRDTGNENGL